MKRRFLQILISAGNFTEESDNSELKKNGK